MGDFLTKPITEKNATDGKDARLMYGACSMQGWRKSNEDAHIHTLDLGDGNSLFAVFDGHGGEQVARFCEKHFPEILLASEEYQAKNYERALEESFVETDFMLVSDEGYDKLQEVVLELKREARGAGAKLEMSDLRDLKSIPFAAGCTANVCLVTQDSIYCANAGDSRSILVSKSGKVTELSQDHKPDDPGEFKRIKAGGGFVEDGRVQGIIAVSRAIGDWEYKNPALLQQLESKKPLRKKSTRRRCPRLLPCRRASVPTVKSMRPKSIRCRHIQISRKFLSKVTLILSAAPVMASGTAIPTRRLPNTFATSAVRARSMASCPSR